MLRIDDEELEPDGEDVDVCVAAVVEDTPIVGVRRSARLSTTVVVGSESSQNTR